MKSDWNGPGARLYSLICMSFVAGMLTLLALAKYMLRDDNEWMLWAAVAVMNVVAVGINAVRFRRIMPS